MGPKIVKRYRLRNAKLTPPAKRSGQSATGERLLSESEKRFCLENKIDHDLALGKKLDDSPINRIDPFWIEGSFSRAPILEQLDALVIVGETRFANAMIQFANAYSFALRYGVPYIYHSGFDFFKDDFLIGDTRIIKGLPTGGRALKSYFFHNGTLGELAPRISSRC